MFGISRADRLTCLLFAATAVLLATPALATAAVADFAGESHNVLPAGNGNLSSPHATDQIPLYDGLTPLFDNVTAGDLDTYFKPATFGPTPSGPGSAEGPALHPVAGVTIQYDNFGVPHITGDTRDDVMFAAGYVQATDRWPIMFALRGAGKVAALDAPGYDIQQIAEGFGTFAPTSQAQGILNQQIDLLESKGSRGKRIIRDIDEYVSGVNFANAPLIGHTYTRLDVLGGSAMVGATFGGGGGNEVRASQLLDALQSRYGSNPGRAVWNDLASKNESDAAATITNRPFRVGSGNVANSPGNAIVDNGSLTAAAQSADAAAASNRRAMSNALLIGPGRSASGHPLLVAGPQTGYFSPEILYEMDLHGDGIDARGVAFPGSGPYVELGRGPDYSWSATSAGNDLQDQYVEKLCGDDQHYVYKNKCLAMEHVNAGTLSVGANTETVEFDQTVHGPVSGYATVNGERVAISMKRSTRGREAVNAIGFAELNEGRARTPLAFISSASKIELTFNWMYANDRHIAMFSSGRIPSRSSKLDWGLPVWGTGQYEWKGYLSRGKHPQVVDPPSGVIANWNNKPALGFQASDSQWGYGSVYRSSLLDHAQQATLPGSGKHTLASTVSAMNRAATQDLRATELLPEIKNVLDSGSSPSPRDTQMVQILEDWVSSGGSRLDLDLNGEADDPGAAVMDALWPRLADAVMDPVLGPQLSDPSDLRDQLAGMLGRDNHPGAVGSAFQGGWYSYVDKDLRDIKPLAGNPVTDAYQTRFCGSGNLSDCAASLWQAVDAAGDALESAQGSDPSLWRADATAERIHFAGIGLTDTMRWTNRPTFQQAMSYSGHR